MKKRVITAIILIAIAVLLIYLGGWWTVGLVTFGCIGGVIEILRTGKNRNWNPAVYIVTMLGALMMLFWWFIMCYIDQTAELFTIPNPYQIRVNVIAIAAFLIGLLTVEVSTKKFMMNDVYYLFTMTFFICLAGQGLIMIRQELGLNVLAYVVFCTYCCDTFAFLTGRFFGKHQFAPITSPKKTWEGVIGGVGITTILGFIFFLIFPFTDTYFWLIPIFSLILAIGAVCGDLIFSSIKRQLQLKDFGTLLPGHGGILDRIDSLLFNILIFIAVYGFVSMGAFS